METMTVGKRGKVYLLLNLTAEYALELKTNSEKLSRYFHRCLETGSNICAVETVGNTRPTTSDDLSRDASSSSASKDIPSASTYKNEHSTNVTSESTGKRTFSFLCGAFEKQNFVYGVKFEKHPWHYFDELDSRRAEHGSLPASVDETIRRLDGVKTIYLQLNEEQSRNYFENGKFIFKNKELKTQLTIAGEELGTGTSKSIDKSTKRLVFISGQTNPSLFVNEFEKCSDVKSDKDKMYQILDFVDECHKGDFTRLYFTSDWASVKAEFLKTYSLSFAKNKKRHLNIDFAETSSLRSFVELKLSSLSMFTTLPFLNQIEMVMNDLPVEVSSLFIVHEKMTANKTEILNFCDSIQDLVETTQSRPIHDDNESRQPSGEMEMEIFNFTPEATAVSSSSRHGRGRGAGKSTRVRGGKVAKRGRPSKIVLSPVRELDESTDSFSFLGQMDTSSRSSWTE